MFRRQVAVGVAFTVMIASAFASPVVADKPIPLAGNLEGTITRTPIPPLMKVDVDGNGVATVLGRYSLEMDAIANPAAQTAEGTYTLVAANGDKVFAQFTGQSYPLNDQGLAYVVESATITGGTGRFAGASGSFVVERLADRDSGYTVGEFRGTILN